MELAWYNRIGRMMVCFFGALKCGMEETFLGYPLVQSSLGSMSHVYR